MAGGESYYNGHLSDYSEDFEEDEDPVPVARAEPVVPAVPMKPPPPQVQKASPQTQSSGVGVGKAARSTPLSTKSLPPKRRILGTEKTRAFSDTKRLSKGGKPKTYTKAYSQGAFSPRDRVVSAKKRTLKALQNELANTNRELEEARKENRLLNRLQARQERELSRIQTQEGELPQILTRHTEEVRGLREQLHRSQEAARTHHQRANELHQELLRLSDRKKKLEGVVKKKHLLEREALTTELQEKGNKLGEKDRRILELERTVEVMSKNHAQETRQLRQKKKLLSLETEGLRNASQRMQLQLKEKEKEMDVMNIYSQRIVKSMPQRATERQHLETSSSQTDISCPPFKSVSLQSKPAMRARGSQTELESPGRTIEPTLKGEMLVPAGTQTDIEVDTKGAGEVCSQGRRDDGGTSSSGPDSTAAHVRMSHELGRAREQGVSEQVKQVEAVAMTGPVARANGVDTVDGQVPQGKDSSLREGRRAEKGEAGEERQKKVALLARLRALDSQKDPPGSQPITLPRSTAQQTTNVTVAADRSPPKAPPTTTSPARKPDTKPPPPSQGPSGKAETDIEAQKRKKLLLAKLMAIDEGSDPTRVIVKPSTSQFSQPSQKHGPRLAASESITSANRSNTSLQSWPDTIENMHKGKPAFSTEEDPFGKQLSRASLAGATSRKGSGSVRKDEGGQTFLTDGGLGEGPPRRSRPSRRPPGGSIGTLASTGPGLAGGDIGALANTGPGLGGQMDDTKGEVPSVPRENDASYKPSFGRRAQPKPPRNDSPIFGSLDQDRGSKDALRRRDAAGGRAERDYPWENRVKVDSNPIGQTSLHKADEQASSSRHVLGGLQSRTKLDTKSPLLPLRAKAEPGFEMMPGAITSEPDDIEELIL